MTTKRQSGQYELILENRQLVFIFFGAVMMCAIFFALGFLIGRDQRDFGWRSGTSSKLDLTGSAAPEPGKAASSETSTPTDNTNTKSSDQAAIDKELTFYKTVDGKSSGDDMKMSTPQESRSAAAENAANTPAAAAVAPPGKIVDTAANRSVPNNIIFQIAALSKSVDAEVMVRKLKNQGFQAFLVSPPPDTTGSKLYRIQVGPFSNSTLAEQAKAKLIAGGYTPIVKK